MILSLHVFIYTYKTTRHTHTDTQTFSVYGSLSFVCMCVLVRGGGFPPLSGCVYVVWVDGRERGRRVWVYPGTPVIIVSITVSNLSITLRPKTKNLTRFEIVRYLCNLSVSLLEGIRTSDLREFSKFRDFSENRSVLFPSVLVTTETLHLTHDADTLTVKNYPWNFWCTSKGDACRGGGGGWN